MKNLQHPLLKRVSYVVSRISDPVVVSLVFLLYSVHRSGLPADRTVFLLTFLLVVCVLPPVAVLLFLRASRRITNWDLSNRDQRVSVFRLFFAFFAADTALVWFLAPELLHTASYLFFWFLGFFALTYVADKLSGHVAVLTLFSFIIIRWYGAAWWPVILAVPAVAASRVILGRHTVRQVILGFAYSVIYLLVTSAIGFLP